jgi:alkanesulfonate monooxygenase SsuD/methylene tetrahydromethanopterin reductase-like flavin-dependent oxidoreductase (luciferase family)
MRLGVVLQPPWEDDATLLEELGFDLVWIEERDALAPFVVAGALGATTSGVRIVASIAAGPHPVTIAEEAAVADLATGGRLVLAIGGDDGDLLHETIQLLFDAFAARPFRHRGSRWTTPAHLPEHERGEQRVRVTPPPAQLEPTVWLHGRAAAAVSLPWALAFVAGEEDESESWRQLERLCGLSVGRLRRPALVRVALDRERHVDADGLIESLRRRQDAWGMDVAILELPAGLDGDERRRALRSIATEVRPRLQLDRLPPGLEQHWSTGAGR